MPRTRRIMTRKRAAIKSESDADALRDDNDEKPPAAKRVRQQQKPRLGRPLPLMTFARTCANFWADRRANEYGQNSRDAVFAIGSFCNPFPPLKSKVFRSRESPLLALYGLLGFLQRC